MSDTLPYDPRYSPPAVVSSPCITVDEFTLETFPREDSADPLPDPTVDMTPLVPDLPPPPDPFEEFQVDRKNISELMDEPSLEGLFRPFDLVSDRPDAVFEDMADLTTPRPFDYEDLDTRDQNVVRTLAQAEARSREIIKKAKAEGFAVIEAARTEAQGLVAEARARAEVEAEIYLESRRREAEEIKAEAESRRGEAESLKSEAENIRSEAENIRSQAESLKSAAEKVRAEAETDLAAAKDRIAGLDREQQEMEAALESRRRELEAEYQGLTAELAVRREKVLEEARAAGQREGYEKGRAEGLAVGRDEGLVPWREKTARLDGLMERLENLYQDLWRANGPMMIQLAIEAAEGILNKELRSAEDLAVRAFESCIDFLSQAHQVVFQARPQDIPLLEEARAEQRGRLGALVKVTFEPDERLGPGDLIMESDVGRLDATVKHRADQVLKVLREAFESAQLVRPAPEPEAETAEILEAPDEAPDEAIEEALAAEENALEHSAAPAAAPKPEPAPSAAGSPAPGPAEPSPA